MSSLRQVADFQEAFGIPMPGVPEVTAPNPGEGRVTLHGIVGLMAVLAENLHQLAQETTDPALRKAAIRLHLCQEELSELGEALVAGDPVRTLDALVDMRYVADGTTLVYGLGAVFDAAVDEVHRSNMTKLGPDGRPVTDGAGRVQKGPSYSPPDLAALLNKEAAE